MKESRAGVAAQIPIQPGPIEHQRMGCESSRRAKAGNPAGKALNRLRRWQAIWRGAGPCGLLTGPSRHGARVGRMACDRDQVAALAGDALAGGVAGNARQTQHRVLAGIWTVRLDIRHEMDWLRGPAHVDRARSKGGLWLPIQPHQNSVCPQLAWVQLPDAQWCGPSGEADGGIIAPRGHGSPLRAARTLWPFRAFFELNLGEPLRVSTVTGKYADDVWAAPDPAMAVFDRSGAADRGGVLMRGVKVWE